MGWFATTQRCKAGVWPGWCVEVSSLHLYKTILLCSCNWHWKPYCTLLTIPTLGTNSNPSFKSSLQWLNKTILEFSWAIPRCCCIWANQSQESASEEHLSRKHLPECCICESWVCTFLSEGFHAFYSNCPFSRTGRWSLAEMIEGYFGKSSVYWQWLSPLLEVKITLLRLDQCTRDLKVYLAKIPCKTNGTPPPPSKELSQDAWHVCYFKCGGVFSILLVSSSDFAENRPWDCVIYRYPWFSSKMKAGGGQQMSSHYQRQ